MHPIIKVIYKNIFFKKHKNKEYKIVAKGETPHLSNYS